MCMWKKCEAKKETKTRGVDYDVILKYSGPIGKYTLLLILVAYYYSIPCGMHQIAAVFISAEQPFHCNTLNIDEYAESTDVAVINIDNAKREECFAYDYQITNCTRDSIPCLENSNRSTQTRCDSYVFDTSVYNSTIVSEWSLVCDRSIITTITTSIFFMGVLFGAIVGGAISDSIGRIPTAVLTQVGLLAFGIGCAFSPNVVVFAILRFSIAAFVMATTVTTFVYVMEITVGHWRTVVGVGVQAAFAVGYMLMTPMAIRWTNWRSLQIAISLSALPAVILGILLPESPRWLFSKGRHEKAKRIVYTMANRNDVELPEDIFEIASVEVETRDKKHSPLILLSKPKIRIVTSIVAIMWFTVALVYYGLSLNIGTLAGSDYLNNVLSGGVEFISFPIIIFAMEKYGRRRTMSVTAFYAGVSCLGATLVNALTDDNSNLKVLVTILALSGKAAVSGAFALIYNYTAELYPTVVRSTGVGVGSMCARVGATFTPFALYLQSSVPWLTGTIFGTLSIVVGGLVSFLPETKGAPLLTTIQEAEEFYGKANRRDTEHHNNKIKYSPGEMKKINEEETLSSLV